jgi:hypothetical protein
MVFRTVTATNPTKTTKFYFGTQEEEKVDHRQLISVGYRWYQPTTVICTSTDNIAIFRQTIMHSMPKQFRTQIDQPRRLKIFLIFGWMRIRLEHITRSCVDGLYCWYKKKKKKLKKSISVPLPTIFSKDSSAECSEQ